MLPLEQLDNLELAIIGMSGRFPRAASLAQFWQNLQQGVESITIFSEEELLQRGVDPQVFSQKNYVRAASFLEDSNLFDASFFGYSPREAELMDPQHRLFLECAWEALESAGYNAESFPGLIGVYASTSLSAYLLFNLLANSAAVANRDIFQVMLGNDKDFLSTRLSYLLNLRGPSLDVQTGCSSSLVALHLACESLLSFQTDMTVVGGVSVDVPQRTGYMYQPEGINSPDGHCRPFDAQAQGTVFGSGVGVVVLKRLTDALRDGDAIYAVIKGSAINNDGSNKVGYTAPGVEGQAEVIARAQALANIDVESISYVEAHGTGTALGDPIEIEALTRAFRRHTTERQFCALGSVKGNIGHLDAAAGIAGLIKTVLSLRHQQLLPSLHYEQPNPAINFTESPFYVNTTLQPWRQGNTPRRAAVSSFGIGGTNAHVILEEAPSPRPSSPSRSSHLLIYSARSEAALQEQATQLAVFLEQTPVPLADIAYTLQVGRKAFEQRAALVCGSKEEAVAFLRSEGVRRPWSGTVEKRGCRIGWFFPGQGSQYVQMGRDLYEHEPLFRREVDRCAQMLRGELGIDLRMVLYPAAEREEETRQQLIETRLAQPALFVVAYALAQVLLSRGVEPDALLGHSVGEYVAACLAGVMRLEDALHLLVVRARFMQAQPAGGMLAVGMSEDEVRSLLHDGISLAAVNGPRACVVSGPWEQIEQVESEVKRLGKVSKRLETSHAFHSAHMDSVVSAYEKAVRAVTLQAPQRGIVSTVTGRWMTAEEARDPGYWARQLREPVRFAAAIEMLSTSGEWVFVEVGGASGLSQQIGKITGGAQGIVLLKRAGEEVQDEQRLLESIGKLWVQGGTMKWERYWEQEQRRRVALPTYPFQRQRFWIDPPPQTSEIVATSTAIRRNSSSGTDLRSDPAEWLYVPTWKRMQATSTIYSSKEQHCWLVFSAEDRLSARLIELLKQEQQMVVEVVVGTSFAQLAPMKCCVNPVILEDFSALLKMLTDVAIKVDRVIDLRPLNVEQVTTTPAQLEAASIGSFSGVLNLARAFHQTDAQEQMHFWIITSHMQDISGVEATVSVVAPMQAFSKVLGQEFPGLHCQCIDIEALPVHTEIGDFERQGALLWHEMTQESAEPLIAYRNNQRWVQIYEPLPIGHKDELFSWSPGGVYLVIGGLGTIGFSIAQRLARTVQARLFIIGSTPLPPRKEWQYILASDKEIADKIQRIQALEALGSEVMYLCADITDGAAFQQSFAAIRSRFQKLHGVFYAAGQSGIRTIKRVADTTLIDCQEQFQVKVKGLCHLASLLQDWNVDFCLIFSSNAAILGGIGSLAYTGAHCFVDAFVLAQAKQSSTRWLTVNWDAWHGAQEEQVAHMKTGLVQYSLTDYEGMDVLELVMGQIQSGQVVVSRGSLSERIASSLRPPSQKSRASAPFATHERPALATAYVPPNNKIEEQLIEIWQELLGIERIGIHDNFFDLGGTSLIGLDLIAHLNEVFHLDVPVVTLFEKSTISMLVKVIDPDQDSSDTAIYERVQRRAERRKERREQRGRV